VAARYSWKKTPLSNRKVMYHSKYNISFENLPSFRKASRKKKQKKKCKELYLIHK